MSKAERTKQFIIEKTAPIFNAKGYVGTSLTDLIEATSLSKGSIYGNFENKDEVALAAFDYNFKAVVSYIKNKMDSRKSTIDKLLVYPEIYRNFLNLTFLKAGCPVLNTATESDDTHPLLKEKANNAIKYWKKSLDQILKEGIKKNEIKPEVNCKEFIVILISVIEGVVMQAKVTGNSEDLNIAMDYIEKMIINLKT